MTETTKMGEAVAVPNGRRDDGCPETLVDVRPWGRFDQFCINTPATVKIITVSPGCRLSLQRHRDRDELWTVLDVELLVEAGGEERVVAPGEKVWIPRGTTHRVSNRTDAPGRFLEIAFGDFDEGDIERLADDYDRV